MLTGCHPQQPFYLFEDGDLSHYVDKATQIEYPDAQTTSLADVENAAPPLTIENADSQGILERHAGRLREDRAGQQQGHAVAGRPLCEQRATRSVRRSAKRPTP